MRVPSHVDFGICRAINRSFSSATTASCLAAIGILFALIGPATAKKSKAPEPPEIFFLGDSHLSFGAGHVFRQFFREFEKNCSAQESMPGQSSEIANLRFGLMGVKSTSPRNWLSNRHSLKKMICEPDPKWPVNARLYGFPHRRDGSYVQLGHDKSFPFCRPKMTGFEALIDWSKPRLLLLYFTGNTIQRWAKAPRLAQQDAARLFEQLPMGTGCVFMTTSPVYRRKHNKERVRAQTNIQNAMAKFDRRCEFVPMLTPDTIAAIEGKARYFRRNKNGSVKDPYHPTIEAARLLVELRRRPLCNAVLKAMTPNKVAGTNEKAAIDNR